jgi:hypothetical protein
MTVAQMVQLLDRQGSLATGNGLQVRCRVVDVKSNFGSTLFLVTPVAGIGQTWVTEGTFKIDKQ